MTRLLLPLVAVTIASLLLPSVNPAYACTCAAAPLEEHVEEADFILTGTVAEVGIAPPLNPETPDEFVHQRTVAFRVDEYLKGAGPSSLAIAEPERWYEFTADGELLGGVGCGTFASESELGNRYILFMDDVTDSPTSPGICSGSQELNAGYLQQIRALLAEPADLPGTGGPPAEPRSDAAPWLAISPGAGALGLVLLAGGVTLALVARRRA